MLRRTRVSNAPDIGRIAEALSRPGIDPRIWSSLAVVTAINIDSTHGPLVDVTLLPSQNLATARLGTEYAGNGFGIYSPIEIDDEVLVEAPSGEPAEGLVVTRRLWSAADPPPTGAVDFPTDLLLHVKQGATLRIVASGGGKVLVGGMNADEPIPLGKQLVDALTELLTTGVLHGPDGPVFCDQAWISKWLVQPSTNILSQVAMTERGGT